MSVYRQNRARRIWQALQRLTAEAPPTEPAKRWLCQQFGCAPTQLLRELPPARAAQLRQQLEQTGNREWLTVLFGKEASVWGKKH